MDARTTSLFDALAHPGAALLLALSDGEATEAQLCASLAGTSQPTVNRRLIELEHLGVIERDAGRVKAPGRAWRLTEPAATEAILQSALALSDILAATEQRRRQAAKRKIKRARAARQGLRQVDGGA